MSQEVDIPPRCTVNLLTTPERKRDLTHAENFVQKTMKGDLYDWTSSFGWKSDQSSKDTFQFTKIRRRAVSDTMFLLSSIHPNREDLTTYKVQAS